MASAKKKKREFVQLPAQAGCVCTCICCLFVCTAVFAFLCVLACAARYSFIEPFCFVYYMPRCVCIHYLHAHSAGSQYELLCVRLCVYAQVCVCLLNADGSTSWWPTAGKRERGWESGRTDKKEWVQSSEADDCVFVGVNLFITDATEISIEMILVTDFALDISDGRHPNVYVYRTGAGSAERDAGIRKSDG